ncbi:hypothetical protein WT72_17895 [Burkholderia pseudomultivorans]|uniref:hypothetical protein n=1 Tax=Burkholderia pseudomultivorans TaxID=1207504 RepID=UPI00075811D0|nr:hypothetical protein WT72_17895 [Burkholderia pseudomultivorans]
MRITLALKDVAYDTLPVDIRAGEHRAPDYVAHVDDAFRISRSLARDHRLPRPALSGAASATRHRRTALIESGKVEVDK